MQDSSQSGEIVEDPIYKSDESANLKELRNSVQICKAVKKDISEEMKKSDKESERNLGEYLKKIDIVEEKLNSILSHFESLKKDLNDKAEPMIDKTEKLKQSENLNNSENIENSEKPREPDNSKKWEKLENLSKFTSDEKKEIYAAKVKMERLFKHKKHGKLENLEIQERKEGKVNKQTKFKERKRDNSVEYEPSERSEDSLKSEKSQKLDQSENSVILGKNKKQNKNQNLEKVEKKIKSENQVKNEKQDKQVNQTKQEQFEKSEKQEKLERQKIHQKKEMSDPSEKSEDSEDSDYLKDLENSENPEKSKNFVNRDKHEITEKSEKLINLEKIKDHSNSQKSDKLEKIEIKEISKNFEKNEDKLIPTIIPSIKKRIKRLPSSFQTKNTYEAEENQLSDSSNQNKEKKNIASIKKAGSAIYMSQQKNLAIFKSMEENNPKIVEKPSIIKHKIVRKLTEDIKSNSKNDFFDRDKIKYLQKNTNDNQDQISSDDSSDIETINNVGVNPAKHYIKKSKELSKPIMDICDVNTTKEYLINDPTIKDEKSNKKNKINIPVNDEEKIFITQDLLVEKNLEKENSTLNDLDVFASINETLAQMIGGKPNDKKNKLMIYNKISDLSENTTSSPKSNKNTKVKISSMGGAESIIDDEAKECKIIKKIPTQKLVKSLSRNKNKISTKEKKSGFYADMNKPIIVHNKTISSSSSSDLENFEKVERSESKEKDVMKKDSPKESFMYPNVAVKDPSHKKLEENRSNTNQIIKKNSWYYRDSERNHEPKLNNKLSKENMKENLPLHNIDCENVYVEIADDASINSKNLIVEHDKRKRPSNVFRESEKYLINKLLNASLNKDSIPEVKSKESSNKPSTDSGKKVTSGKYGDSSTNSSISDKDKKPSLTEKPTRKRLFKIKGRSKSNIPKLKR